MTRTKRSRNNKKLLTLGGRKVNGKLSAAIRKAVEVKITKKPPPPSKRKKYYHLSVYDTLIAYVQHHGSWWSIAKWNDHEKVTLVHSDGSLKPDHFTNSMNLFDLPEKISSFDGLRIVIGDLYDVFGNFLCKCPFPQVTDNVDGSSKWYYILEYVQPEACLRLHVALVKVWGTPNKPMQPDIPVQMPSIDNVW